MSSYKIRLEGEAETFEDLLRIFIDALGNINDHTNIVKSSGFRMSDTHSSGEFSLDVSLVTNSRFVEVSDPDAGIHGMGNVFGR